MGIQTNQAYIAIRSDGFVDGACFTESQDAQDWCNEMKFAGMKIEVRDRAEAKRILFTTLPNFCVTHPSRRIVLLGESLGRYMDRDIPAWYETADGQRHEYVGVAGQQVDLDTLSEGQSVIAPGLIYREIQ